MLKSPTLVAFSLSDFKVNVRPELLYLSYVHIEKMAVFFSGHIAIE